MFLETQQNTAKDALHLLPGQFEHYITKNIKSFYKRRLLTPILYLIFLLVTVVRSLSCQRRFFRTRSMPRIPSRAPTDGMKNTYPPPYPI